MCVCPPLCVSVFLLFPHCAATGSRVCRVCLYLCLYERMFVHVFCVYVCVHVSHLAFGVSCVRIVLNLCVSVFLCVCNCRPLCVCVCVMSGCVVWTR